MFDYTYQEPPDWGETYKVQPPITVQTIRDGSKKLDENNQPLNSYDFWFQVVKNQYTPIPREGE